MTDKVQIKNRILEVAKEKFLKFGYKKVTTDEIAHEVGISKRTLYELFKTKYDLVREILLISNHYIEVIIQETLNNKTLNPLQKITRIAKAVRSKNSIFNIQNLTLIKRDFPEMAKETENSMRTQMDLVYSIFKEGAEQAIFRKDIKPDIFFTLFQSLFDKFHAEEITHIFPYSIEEIMEDLTKVIIQGILTKESIIQGYADHLDI
jgi:AcrR family transcriptional regulator